MPTTRSKRSSIAEELAELRDTVEQLVQHVHLLTLAVDALTDEVQWQNNQAREKYVPSPPLVLHSMPKDPTTKEWRINQVRPEDVADKPATPSTSGTLFD